MGYAGNRAHHAWALVPRTQGPRFNLAFEYIGHSAMTVVGPASGQRYRFTPGAILAVDPRDRTALAAIPLLRRR
jgi:hypothetical protein